MNLEQYLELVEERGNVMNLGKGGVLETRDFDEMFRRLSKDAKYEYVLFVEPYLVTRVHDMLNNINATADELSKGYFENKTSALAFIPEAVFSRGSYRVSVFQKSICGGLLMPTYPLSVDDMVKNSVRIKL